MRRFEGAAYGDEFLLLRIEKYSCTLLPATEAVTDMPYSAKVRRFAMHSVIGAPID